MRDLLATHDVGRRALDDRSVEAVLVKVGSDLQENGRSLVRSAGVSSVWRARFTHVVSARIASRQ
jgi:hypothetical protein